MIRNLARNHSIRLQVANRGPLTDGLTRAEMLLDPVSWRGLEGNIFQTGQPPDVREAFLRRWTSTERNSRRPTISLTSRPRRVEVIAHTV